MNDEKRQLINVRDTIEFENRFNKEKIRVKVLVLHKFNNFLELYNAFNKVSLRYNQDEVSDMEVYYSKEEQVRYGVLGIEVVVI